MQIAGDRDIPVTVLFAPLPPILSIAVYLPLEGPLPRGGHYSYPHPRSWAFLGKITVEVY